MEAHKRGLLHRAFSVFIFNSKGDLLLQQRAFEKYHNGGLWTNSCCSHPLPGEEVLTAAERRLLEEMGFKTDLTHLFSFIYKATFNNGLTEFEFDHVFTGTYDGVIKVDQTEVNDFSFKNISDVEDSLKAEPQAYTEWFKLAFPKIKEFHGKTF